MSNRKPRQAPPFSTQKKQQVQQLQLSSFNELQGYLVLNRSDIVEEVWKRYVSNYMGWDSCWYDDYSPRKSEIPLWFDDLRTRTIAHLATEAPGQNFNDLIDAEIARRKTWLEEQVAKPKYPACGYNLESFRKRIGFSQEEMAGALSDLIAPRKPVAKNRINEYEAGKHTPSSSILRAYAKIFARELQREVYPDLLLKKSYFERIFPDIF